MPWITGGAILGGALISGALGADAASNAADASSAASAASIAEQRRQFDINQANQAPYLEAGRNALSYLGNNIGDTGTPLPQYTPTAAFNFDPSQLANTPGYQFQLQQGVNAIDASAARGGNLNSGARLLELQKFGQGLADQTYGQEYARQMGQQQNAFGQNLQNYNVNIGANQDAYGRQQNVLNRYASLAGIGQTSANQVGSMGANAANNIGNINMNNASNQANAGYYGAGSINNAIQGGIGNYLTYDYLNKKTPPPTYSGPLSPGYQY
jgi:hypothetical protein